MNNFSTEDIANLESIVEIKQIHVKIQTRHLSKTKQSVEYPK